MKKILIVEDEFIIAEDIKVTVKEFGYEVIKILPSSNEVIKFLESSYEKPDLILLDIKIEGAMNGVELAKYIKDKYNIPMIFCTAYHGQEIDNLYNELGIKVVKKPYLDYVLKEAIDTTFKIKNTLPS